MTPRPARSKRTIRRGDNVRFIPALGAYSPHCAQAQYCGQTGNVYIANDSYAMVWFADRLVPINTAYLHLTP